MAEIDFEAVVGVSGSDDIPGNARGVCDVVLDIYGRALFFTIRGLFDCSPYACKRLNRSGFVRVTPGAS